MPFSNKRNSRDDKSKRPGPGKSTSSFSKHSDHKYRSPNASKNDGRETTKKSIDYRDKRSDGEQKPFGSTGERTYRKERTYGKNTEKRSYDNDKRPYNSDKRPYDNDKRPYDSGKRTYGNRPYDSSKKRRERSDVSFKREPESDGLIRLNRYIANAGVCSRRKADELIEAGVITVNGEVVTELGVKVDPSKDEVRYNGERLKREKMVYVLLNKPKDYITTTDDPQERRTVMHLVAKASKERIYPVGRLDRNTTGLLLLTNDGNLAEKLSHPRNSVVKIYNVELDKNLTQGDLNKISFGLELEDGLIKPDAISYVQGGSKREIGIQIHSGKNRIVRRIFEHLGYDVIKLDRVVYANLTKKDLPRGRWRYLEEKEIIQLKHFIK
ncbi:pseudouridine synthase [Parapedobacter indicus]|uniref:Pseudouridine synthase n=1 Tax=Parapedobacter indicus TaxID=1477437 RepID=A0A1I3LPF9_9SPHI|nr:pseudouridine synthase [Parapedobacter indicus]PPL01418.1 23S rRNA pseudouridine2605 synthase [Parapedobacter indicus]SFI86664.1 23S rRNA pseudouridine2605 synthase [Parapedobacter indicus]